MISDQEIQQVDASVRPLIGLQLDLLLIPEPVLTALEPSQIGTIVGTLMDATLPLLGVLPLGLPDIGITKHEGILKDREGYPDYLHNSGKRIELKGLYVDNPTLPMKRPTTPREPSARITQKVTVKNVDPERDLMLLLAYQLQVNPRHSREIIIYSPTVVDLALFKMAELVHARDERLARAGGRWFGDYETPAVPSKSGLKKLEDGKRLAASYGRKESEGKDYNEDTNFGKLKRIPHATLQAFLRKHLREEANEGPESNAEEAPDAQ